MRGKVRIRVGDVISIRGRLWSTCTFQKEIKGGLWDLVCTPWLSCGVIFTMSSHTFALFWSRRKSVIFEKYQSSFCVFVYAFPLEFPSFFDKSFPFVFPFFVLSVLQYFAFHVVSNNINCYLFCFISIINTISTVLTETFWHICFFFMSLSLCH